MAYQLFYDLCPATAKAETRSITVLDTPDRKLPVGEYAFCEMFCNEPGCDCRRVFFYVVSSFRAGPEATIAWGWESPEFYAKWLHDDDPDMVSNLIGPVLNLGSPETALADDLVDLVRDVLLQNELYIERIKRHYRQFREKIDGRNRGTKAGPNFRKKKKKR